MSNYIDTYFYIKVYTKRTHTFFSIGSIVPFRYRPTDEWLLCDGRVLDKYDFPVLFDTIGYKYSNKEVKLPFYILRKLLGIKTTKEAPLLLNERYFRIPNLLE